MKKLKKATVEYSVDRTVDPADRRANYAQKKPELGKLQTDRSFLPVSTDQPVHKCGCT